MTAIEYIIKHFTLIVALIYNGCNNQVGDSVQSGSSVCSMIVTITHATTIVCHCC